MNAAAYLHASALVVGEKGVLVRGPSGAGKSRLVAALKNAAEVGGRFARLIGDDRIALDVKGGRVVAAGHPAVTGLIERRGLGLCRGAALSPAVIGHVVDLVPESPRLPETADETIWLEGVELPYLQIDRRLSGSDQAALVLFWLFG